MSYDSYYHSIWNHDAEMESTLQVSIGVKPRLNTQSIDTEENVKLFEIDDKIRYISEYFTSNHLIPPGHVDLLQCGTGKGKTYRTTKGFLNEARRCNYNIMLILPRNMIVQQVLSEMSSKEVSFSFDNGVYHIDNLTICTYQKLYNELKKIKRIDNTIFGREYRAVIFDESHVILEDSLFSEAANFILDEMFDFFRTKVSYYFLSATMKYVERIIYETACEKLKKVSQTYMGVTTKNPPFFRKFVFPNTYEKYNVTYLDTENEIVKLYNELPDSRKLLIFVSSKQMGERLSSLMPDSVFLFAENDDEKLSDEAQLQYSKIKELSSFDCKALITTKLLDAGVNFKMKDLRDIVINIEGGEDEFIQIVGRRRAIDDAVINLHIMKMDSDYFRKRRFNCVQKLNAISDIKRCNKCMKQNRIYAERFNTEIKLSACKTCYKNAKKKYYLEPKNYMLIQGLFTVDGQNVVINKMAEAKLKLMVDFYDSILDDFNTVGEQAYIIRQLSWLGLENTYSESNYFSKESIPVQLMDLSNLLEEYQEKEMNDELQADFRQEFQEIAIKLKLYSKRSENSIGLNKINQIIEEAKLSYKVESQSTSNGTAWKVIKKL